MFVAEFAARTAFKVFVFNDFRLAFEISRIIRIHAEFGNCVPPEGSYVFFECGCDMHHSGISGEYAVCVAYHLGRLVYGQSVGEIEYIAASKYYLAALNPVFLAAYDVYLIGPHTVAYLNYDVGRNNFGLVLSADGKDEIVFG